VGEYTVNPPSYPEQELDRIDVVDEKRLLDAGVDITGKERSGSFIQVDGSVLHAKPTQDGIEVMSTRKALDEYPWLSEYLWKIVRVDSDKYTARAELEFQDG